MRRAMNVWQWVLNTRSNPIKAEDHAFYFRPETLRHSSVTFEDKLVRRLANPTFKQPAVG